MVEVETASAGAGVAWVPTSAQPLMGLLTLYGHVPSLSLGFFIGKGLSTLGRCSEVVAMKKALTKLIKKCTGRHLASRYCPPSHPNLFSDG